MKIQLTAPDQNCAGLGDAITWAWLSAGTSEPMEFVAKGGQAELLRIFGGTVTDDPTGAILPDDCYYDEIEAKGAVPRCESWAKSLGIDWQRKELKLAEVFQKQNPRRIILAPQCQNGARTWPAAYWIDLSAGLRKVGWDVHWLFGKHDPAFEIRGQSETWIGLTFEAMISLFQSAALVIANDSMPAHLAGTLGVNTIALLGPTTHGVFAHFPKVICLASDLDCTGCHFNMPCRRSCALMCESLARLSPRKILEAVEYLKPAIQGI